MSTAKLPPITTTTRHEAIVALAVRHHDEGWWTATFWHEGEAPESGEPLPEAVARWFFPGLQGEYRDVESVP